MKRLLLILFLLASNFVFAQQFAKDHSDCGNSMEEVTESNLGPITLDGTSGNNTVADHKKRSLYFFYKEHNIAWLKFRVQKDTLLTFDLVPQKKTDDIDFLLFRYSGGDGFCDSLRAKKIKPVRTNISKPDSGSEGRTGLSLTATQDFVPWGKGPAYSKALPVKKGEVYYLVLDNFTEGGQDVSIENVSATPTPQPEKKSTIDAVPVKVGPIKVECPLTITVVDEDSGTPIKGTLDINGLQDNTLSIKDTSTYSAVLGASQSISVNCNSKGYFFYTESTTKKTYVWEYLIKKETRTNPQRMTNINLIYSDEMGELTIPKIITNFSTYDSKDKRMSPVFQMSSNGIFPIDETLLPLFKRRIAGLISQTKVQEENQETE